MKWWWMVSVVILLFMGVAQAEEQVRPSSIGEMVIRAVPPLTAATVTVRAADYVPKHGWAAGASGVRQAVEIMLTNGYEKLARWMKEGGRPAGPSFVVFNEDPQTTPPQNMTCKIGYPVAENAGGKNLVTIERLPATTSAVVRHQGSLDDRAALRDSLGKWIFSRGYAPAGPFMEVYVNGTRAKPVPSDDVAEIRWPVRRMAQPHADGNDPPGSGR
ncbi:MAG TPA: GyrI-like domain-containing protein [bacterium]|jgi:effector-binding domain-containing protein